MRQLTWLAFSPSAKYCAPWSPIWFWYKCNCCSFYIKKWKKITIKDELSSIPTERTQTINLNRIDYLSGLIFDLSFLKPMLKVNNIYNEKKCRILNISNEYVSLLDWLSMAIKIKTI